MAIEAPRLCGYRKVGGLYLCGSGEPTDCDRLPYELKICPVCGSGIKFTRGFQWLDWRKYAGWHEPCHERREISCPVCAPLQTHQPYCLLWVGEQNYTPEEFIREAVSKGISKRIPQIPRGLELGFTHVLLAHTSACGVRDFEQPDGKFKKHGVPGVFSLFRPSRIEQLIWESHVTPEKLRELKRRNITPIIIPDNDKEHDPDTPAVPNEAVRVEAKNAAYFDELRLKLKRE